MNHEQQPPGRGSPTRIDDSDNPNSPLYDIKQMTFSFNPTKPGPQPHNAGITPGYRHLVHAKKPVTIGRLRKLLLRRDRDVRRAIELLVGQVTDLQAEVTRLRGKGGAA